MDIFSLLGISKYSNSEIITPQKVADAMVNLLPDEVFTPDTTFLDPACKSGVFLTTLKNKLMNSDKMIKAFPDKKERQQHILEKQLFGIATSQTSWVVSMRAIYGCIPEKANIVYISNYLQRMADKTTDYKKLIKEGFKQEMTFDVIIGNPPYQSDDGGGDTTKSSQPLYNKFMNLGIQLASNYILMIMPSRWLSGGKQILDVFRRDMIESKHIKSIYNYNNPKDVFGDVRIAGGVLYMLYDKSNEYNTTEFYNCTLLDKSKTQKQLNKYTYFDAHNKQQYLVVTDKYADSIIEKIENSGDTIGIGIQYDPFGLLADFEDSVVPFENSVKVICSNGRETYTERERITRSVDKIDKYKVCVAKASPEGGSFDPKADQRKKVLTINGILNPREICTITYFVIGSTNTLKEAQSLLSLVKTKFFRYLVMVTISGMNLSQRNFRFIPQIKDFTHPWTDEELYKKYNLTQEEIDYIESTIKPME